MIGAALTQALDEIGLTKYALAQRYAKKFKLHKETAYARTASVSEIEQPKIKKTIRILDEILRCADLQVLIVPRGVHLIVKPDPSPTQPND
jgi:hypothetical protein